VFGRFARYLERVFQFRGHCARLTDRRITPRIPSRAVWLCVLSLYLLRLRSLNALEQAVRTTPRWAAWLGASPPSADTIGYALARFDVEALRALLAQMHHRIKRMKALCRLWPEPYWVAALDGHELWSSRSRHCAACLVREVPTAQGPVREYYHRIVLCQLVGATPPLLLDLELQGPEEGEVTTARRLLARVLRTYPRFFQVLTLDALYLEAPLVNQALAAGKAVVVVLKQEARHLYQDVQGLLPLTPPRRIEGPTRSVLLWDIPELQTFTGVARPVRVVHSREATQRRRRVAGQWHLTTVVQEWYWVTTLPPEQVSAATIRRWGHARWDIENRGFNELVQHWHLDHCFKHEPTAIQAFLLTLAMAFALTSVFFARNLKPPAKAGRTRLFLAWLLAEGLMFGGDRSGPHNRSP
jgi:hypothetical protein